MDLRARLIGILLVACGLALCYGAAEMWPSAVGGGSPDGSGMAGSVLRFAVACIAAVLGVGNVFAGFVVVLRRTARD
ncbi:MAG: hypothetical protein U1F10_07585 [Burkholderiales bacterium]